MQKFESESRLSLSEATSLIVGHGVGSGILAVPYLASRNNWTSLLWIIPLVYCFNLLLHLMVAELSYDNGGAQFIKCFERELFRGKIGKMRSRCGRVSFVGKGNSARKAFFVNKILVFFSDCMYYPYI